MRARITPHFLWSANVSQGGATTLSDQTSRRGFLKRIAIVGAAASALGLLSRRPFGSPRASDRSIPPDLPGQGSIFQPRNDRRQQR